MGAIALPYVPYCTVAAVEPLLGVDLGITDLYATSSELERSKTILTDETLKAVKEARRWHRQWWKI